MSKVRSDAARDNLWNRLTLITLGLTALVSLCCLVALLSPSLLSGFLPVEKMTSTPAVALALPEPKPTFTPTDTSVPTWTPLPTRPPRPSPTSKYTPTASHTNDSKYMLKAKGTVKSVDGVSL